MKRDTARTNKDVKKYMEWLKEKLAMYIAENPPARHYPVPLLEKVWFGLAGYEQRVFILDSPTRSALIVKVYGSPAYVRALDVDVVKGLFDGGTNEN